MRLIWGQIEIGGIEQSRFESVKYINVISVAGDGVFPSRRPQQVEGIVDKAVR